ncbi:MAG: sigma 54-interacting transcriptional regulator [Treponema sp.]|nr:sigma 54-interacting transcriptional regulator [Treponema sp.]
MESFALEKLQTLVDINSRINSNYSDKDALLVYILESAMRLVECESSSFLLMNRADDTLRFVVALGPKGKDAKNIPVSKKSIAGWVVEHKQHVIVNDVLHDERFSDVVQKETGYITGTMIAVPVCTKTECIGVIELLNKAGSRNFDSSDVDILQLMCSQAAIAYENAETYAATQRTISVLQDTIASGTTYHPFIAKSAAITDLLKDVAVIAQTNSSVLITGESGVGKELFAEQLHLRSRRAQEKFLRVNCAALSPSLLESELFGHVKGAFTGATETRIGRFEAAAGGTIFLDEIGELSLDVQAKLLRVLQTKEFEKVGSSTTLSVDVRVIAATNRDLEAMVKAGTFRSDLYYRLNVVPIAIPPLRSRKEDIASLADFFLEKFSRDTKKNFTGFSEAAMRVLLTYYWPGNVRELENSIERACVLGTPPTVGVDDLRITATAATGYYASSSDLALRADEWIAQDGQHTLKAALHAFKRAYVTRVLESTGWNQTKAGKILGIQRTYVSRLITELHIREAEHAFKEVEQI